MKRAFTLTELMLAVAILIVVIIATSKIFGTASQVTGLAEATAAVMQEAATVERQIREDFKRLSNEGFLLIRCVRVRNDVNYSSGGPLLDPSKHPEDYLRADQLFFFVEGAQQMMTLGTRGTNIRGLGLHSRVYYGHAIQLPNLKDASGPPGGVMRAHDFKLDLDEPPLLPWHRGDYDTERTIYRHDPGTGNQADYETSPGLSEDATQPPAHGWLLARQAIVMADDGDDQPERYLYGNRTAYAIDHHPVFHGRVDGVSQLLQDVRRVVTAIPDPEVGFPCDGDTMYSRPWYDPTYSDDNGVGDQRSVIAAMCGRRRELPVYPRAERTAPGMQRIDQALTNHVIATASSSFTVDWTYAPRVGEVRDGDGEILWTGVMINADPDNEPSFREHPWFGLEDVDRGVYMYRTGNFDNLQPDLWPWWNWAATIAPDNIEQMIPNTGDVEVYEAIFGFNQGTPLNDVGDPDPIIYSTGAPDCTRVGYTPWPTAIRITVVLHDQQLRLGTGRQFQFVINLPRQ